MLSLFKSLFLVHLTITIATWSIYEVGVITWVFLFAFLNTMTISVEKICPLDVLSVFFEVSK